jgi:hypothetical protein
MERRRDRDAANELSFTGKPGATQEDSMRPWRLFGIVAGSWLSIASSAIFSAEPTSPAPLDFTVTVDTILEHDDGQFLWFHPRAAAIPGVGRDAAPAVVLTLQKHLTISDYYSGLSVMRSDDLGATWTPPDPRPELDWVPEGEGVDVAVCDVTPGWHAPSGKLLAIGTKVRYSRAGEQLAEKPRSNEAAYAVYDPATGGWSRWRMIDMPETDGKFYLVCPGCVQWLVEQDGTLLIPVYYAGPNSGVYACTVLRCSFDGQTIKYLEHGDEIELPVVRGLCEPSLARFDGRYFLTIRNDEGAYVTASDDGLHYVPIQPWRFDDGVELGSYNTQQHWLTHSDGLFLIYTRRGADNDHVFRHRAPLFMARVDPDRLCALRETEKVIITERGATLGNFGCSAVSPDESWVTVSEGVWSDEIRARGAKGATFVARVRWSRPNQLVAP